MADQISFLPLLEGRKIERTQATYYTSDMYPEPMTPEYILGAKSSYAYIPKKGQIAYPMNRWTSYDAWYLTNHWIHRQNDKYVFGLFGWAYNGLHDTTIDDQPDPMNYSCRRKVYDDDIPGQVAGAVCVGLQLGVIFGVLHTTNFAREANLYQTIAMPNNRWLPLHKATFAFKSRIFITCMTQSSIFLAAYALVDGCMSQLRHTDDVLNPVCGGIASGVSLYTFYNKPFNCIPAGFYFGCVMAWLRFMVVPDSCPKLALDFSRPGWGVIGGLPMWIANEEVSPQQFWYSWFLSKDYWLWSPG